MSSGRSSKVSSGGGWSGVVSICAGAFELADVADASSGFFSGFPDGFGFGGGAEEDITRAME